MNRQDAKIAKIAKKKMSKMVLYFPYRSQLVLLGALRVLAVTKKK